MSLAATSYQSVLLAVPQIQSSQITLIVAHGKHKKVLMVSAFVATTANVTHCTLMPLQCISLTVL